MSQTLHNYAIHIVSFTYDAWKKYDFLVWRLDPKIDYIMDKTYNLKSCT